MMPFFAALLGALALVSAASAAPPNFVFILTDDQDILLNGTSAMPALHEHLVRGGASFTGFVDVPVCCPSRTSTLTSRYSHNLNNTFLGWCGNYAKQHENHTWIGLLKSAGYATGMFGKYFNDYSAFCGRNVHVPSDLSYVHLMCDDNLYFGNSFNVNGTMRTVGEDVYLTNVIGNSSLAWLAQQASAGGPFFAYIAPHAPHVPATPAHEYENAPLPSETAPRTPSWDYATQHHHWLVSEKAPLTPALVTFSDQLHARRLRATMSVDDIVAAVFALLQDRGLLENTYVIYSSCAGPRAAGGRGVALQPARALHLTLSRHLTRAPPDAASDHGYDLGQFRLPSGKFHAFENDIRVPFHVAGPGVTAGADLNTTLVNNVDIGATVLDLAGLGGAGYETDGRSFASQLSTAGRAARAWPRDRLITEYWGLGYTERGPCKNGTSPCPGGVQALEDAPSNSWSGLRILNTTHNLAYVEYRRGSGADAPIEPASTNFTMLFDMQADPWQLVNLARNGSSAALVAALHSELWQVANCQGAACP